MKLIIAIAVATSITPIGLLGHHAVVMLGERYSSVILTLLALSLLAVVKLRRMHRRRPRAAVYWVLAK